MNVTKLYIETYDENLANTPTCYDEGVESEGAQYEATVKETSATSQRYQGTIGGHSNYQPYFDDNMKIEAMGEETGSDCTAGDWSSWAAFVVWQRWNYAINSWYTIQNSQVTQDCPWSVQNLYYINDNDQYFYDYGNYTTP